MSKFYNVISENKITFSYIKSSFKSSINDKKNFASSFLLIPSKCLIIFLLIISINIDICAQNNQNVNLSRLAETRMPLTQSRSKEFSISPFKILGDVDLKNIINVRIDKPGSLKKILKKIGQKNPLSITHLKIAGDINYKDVEFLNQMTNLVYFDASEIVSGEIDMSIFSELEYISFPTKSSNILQGRICGELKSIIVPSDRSSFGVKYTGMSIQNVYINGVSRSEFTQSSPNFEIDSPLRKEYHSHKIKVDTLFVPNIDGLFLDAVKAFDPCFVVLHAENQIILNRWKPINNQSIVDLSGISYIMPYSFKYIDNLEKIECSESMAEVFDYAFWGCRNLKEVVLKNVKKIGSNVFEKTKIKEIIFPKSLRYININTFQNSLIEKVVFNGQYPPTVIQSENNHSYWPNNMKNIEFHIPENSMSTYLNVINWKDVLLIEKGTNTAFEISVENPGNIEKLLTDDLIINARSLIVKGTLYDTDLEKLKACKYLQSLDLSQIVISKSPETIMAEKAQKEFLYGMLGYVTKMTMEDSEKLYKQGKISGGQHVSTNLLAEGVKESVEADKKKRASNSKYVIHKSELFNDWKFLKTIKLPSQNERKQ